MLVLDGSLLGDYLDGTASARAFLRQYENREWAVPSIVLYAAAAGSVHGYVDGTPDAIRQAVTASMDVLPVTERTADEAAALQTTLLERGVAVDHTDALIAATAREHGGTFATAAERFWTEDVQSVVSVAEYDPD